MSDTPIIEGKGTAIAGESLFLLNLLMPILPFLALFIVYLRHRNTDNQFLRTHLKQPLIGALISTTLFLLGNLFVILTSGYKSVQALITFEVYYIAVVPLFLIPGLFGMIKAMSGDPYRYPLIGKFL